MKVRSWMLSAVVVFAGVGPLEAKATWVKKAQAEAPDVKSCLDCHTAVKVTAEDLKLTPRGEFLMDKKKATGAAEIDFKWLKDYKPAKK